MASDFISIKDAASICGKSEQTIRRLIKAKKHSVKIKKSRTPQGFNYMIDRTSLMAYYGIKPMAAEKAEKAVAKEEAAKPSAPAAEKAKVADKDIKELLTNRSHKVLVEYAPVEEFNKTLRTLIKQHSQEKENLFKLVEAFQNKVVTLETKLKSAEADGRKWYKFW